MGIELSSSEVCSRVQLENAFVFITTIVLQSQPISYNLLLRGDGKQLAIFLLVIIFLVQIFLAQIFLVQSQAHSVLSFSTLSHLNSFCLFSFLHSFYFLRILFGFSTDFSISLLKCKALHWGVLNGLVLSEAC